MEKINVIYWSQSGNTEEMANAIVKGIIEAGGEGEATQVSNASLDEIRNANVFALGCPAMGAEVLEEGEMEPFVSEVEGFSQGKTIALFGSYGWGDGEWMRNWVQRMNDAGANVVNQEGCICNESPDDSAIEQCKKLGKQLVTLSQE